MIKNLHINRSFTRIIATVALVVFMLTPGWGQLFESFETGLPSSYNSTLTNVTLGSGVWQIDDVIAGTTGIQTGSKSAQIRSATGAQMITPTLTGGVGTITYYVTSSTASGAYQVNISTDNGATWSAAPGSPFTIGTTKTLRTIAVNNSSVNKVQFYRTGATIYIDDVTINTFTSTTNPNLTITGTTAHASVCPSTSASPITYTITNSGTVAAEGISVISNDAQFVVSGLSSTSIPAGGGTATYDVTFTPTTAGAKTATITVSSTTSGSNSPTSSLTGIGLTPTNQAVTSLAASTIAGTTATLNGNLTTLGICPSSTEKGFVYSNTSLNSDPMVGGTDVITIPVAGLTTGAFSSPLTGLSIGANYSFKAYVYNGTTYTYGSLLTFTTITPLTNDECSGALEIQCGSTITVDNTGATDDILPSITCGGTTSTFKGIWFTFTPASSGSVTLSTCGSATSIDTYLRVYTGSCGSLSTCIGYDDDGCGTTGGLSAFTFASTASTTYYVLVTGYFAEDYGAITLSATCPIDAPVATDADPIGSTSFTANWNATSGATGGYKLDVSSTAFIFDETTETFTAVGGGTSTSYLTRTWTGAAGITWTSYKTRTDQTIFSGNEAICLRDESGAYLVSGEITESPSNITFDIQQKFAGSGGSVVIKILSGTGFSNVTTLGTYGFTTIASVINVPVSGIVGSFKLQIENDALARPCIDNLTITSGSFTQVGVFNNYTVAGTSQVVGSLSANTTYYYRVRATDGTNFSSNSNIITVTTLTPPTITSFTPTSICEGSSADVVITGINFTGATAVKFNEVDATSFEIDNDGQITAVTPSVAFSTGKISVITPGGTVVSVNNFTVTTTVTPAVTIVPDANPVASGQGVTFLAGATNEGSPTYQWFKNNISVGTNSSEYSYSPVVNGDAVYVKMTSTLSCVTSATVTSATVIMGITGSTATTWDGSESSDWHNSSNWSAGIPGASTDVTIPAGLTNYPTLNAAGTCKDILLGSNATSTATLLDNGHLTVTGTASVQRYFSGNTFDWHLVSSPITAATANVFFDMYLQQFDPTPDFSATAPTELVWYTDITSPSTQMTKMKGYGLYSTLGAANTVTFTGTLNTGEQSHLLYRNDNNAEYGWNLLGNPFPSSIDWNQVNIPAGMSNEVHFIEASSGNDLSFVKGSGGAAQFVPPMQGFFVSATSASSFSLGNAQRTHSGADNFYKSENPRMLVLQADGQNFSDKTFIHFNEQAGFEHDGIYDAYKIITTSNPELPQLFSYTPENVKLSVNGMPEISSVPLGFTSLQSGSFTIKALKTGDMIKVVLEDLLTGIQTDLLTKNYTFNYTLGDAEKRFKVHFSTTGIDENESTSANIYSYQQTVYVNFANNTQGDIYIYNLAGQLVSTNESASGNVRIRLNSTGVYMVKVITEKETLTQKVVIR